LDVQIPARWRAALVFALSTLWIGLLGAPAAEAGPLRTWHAYYAEVTLSGPGLPAVAMDRHAYFIGRGHVGEYVSVYSGAFDLGTVSGLFTQTAVFPFTAIQVVLSGNSSGVVQASSGGPIALAGELRMMGVGGLSLLAVPLSFAGTPGTNPLKPAFSSAAATVFGAGWTTKTTVIPLLTPTPSGATVVSAVGSTWDAGNGKGAIVMVSALNVVTSWPGLDAVQVPMFLTAMLYLPEPSTLALLATAAGACALAGWRKLLR
jgi:hypothetical protein